MATTASTTAATVVRNEVSSSRYRTLTVHAPAVAVAAQPGQFVMVSTGPDSFLRRPMGISAVDQAASELSFIYQVVGQGTRSIAAFGAGQTVSVLGPLGRPFTVVESAQRVVLVGGGTGTGPMLFLAMWLRDLRSTVEVTLVLGARTADMHIDTNPIEQLGVTVLLATDDGSLGTKGTVIDLLSAHRPPFTAHALFACGPDRMLEAVAQFAQSRSIPCQLSLEARMACGFGACLGCACPAPDGSYRMVCVDGPVMEASEVVWHK